MKKVFLKYHCLTSAGIFVLALLSFSCTDESENNSLPEIGITTPLDKSIIQSGTDITITAFATGEDGKVDRMDFYEGTNKLGEDSIAPYEYIWKDVKAGKYTLSITTIDDEGSENGSASINIEVVDPQ